MSLNLEERLEDILKTEISSSLYCVNSEFVVAMLGDMVDIFTYRCLVIEYTLSALKYNNKV